VKSSLSISTHTNLVLASTNTHYKPSLYHLELIFAGSSIHPLGALNYNNHGMCGMMYYTVSNKKIVTDDIRVQLVMYLTRGYLYLHPRTSIFVFIFVFEFELE
jgi:hypothetical protein